MNTRILLADDHKIVREGLCGLINKLPGMEVVAEAENGRAAVNLSQKIKPDIVIMDIAMPDLNGVEATRQILCTNKGVKIIVLSMHSDRRLVTEILKAGASGYLLKEDCDLEELNRAIKSVTAKQVYLAPRVANYMVRDHILKKAAGTETLSDSILTSREREVLQLLAEGKRTKQIASCLCVSVKTIETHRTNIMHKLDIYTLAGLVKYAIQEKIISLRG